MSAQAQFGISPASTCRCSSRNRSASGDDQGHAADRDDVGQRAGYVFFGWLSDRIGRKFVMVGGMVLALALYFPGSHWIAKAANPELVEAQAATPVIVVTDEGSCSVQFDPVGTAKFTSACELPRAHW